MLKCNLIISPLKLTQKGPVLTESVNRDARIPSVTATKIARKTAKRGTGLFETGHHRSRKQQQAQISS